MKLCGIDEAGKGPVIGNLVICGVAIDESRISELEAIGVKDSKLLSPKQREGLFEKIKKTVDEYFLVIVTPGQIDEALNTDGMNLNWLEAIDTAKIINKLRPDKVIFDCPSPNKEAYTDYMKVYLRDKDIELIPEHKAERFAIVAAASILAKVTRDRHIAELRKELGIDFGSGYPADPKTKKFLQEYWDKYSEVFRKSWASYKKIVQSKKQKALTGF